MASSRQMKNLIIVLYIKYEIENFIAHVISNNLGNKELAILYTEIMVTFLVLIFLIFHALWTTNTQLEIFFTKCDKSSYPARTIKITIVCSFVIIMCEQVFYPVNAWMYGTENKGWHYFDMYLSQ